MRPLRLGPRVAAAPGGPGVVNGIYWDPALSWEEEPDDLVDVPHEELVIGADAGSWYSLLAHDEDDD